MTPSDLRLIRDCYPAMSERKSHEAIESLLHEIDALQTIIDTHANRECFSGPTGDLATADGSVFEELVAEMRAAQKLCERSRQPKNSIIRRGMEEQVDMELQRLANVETPIVEPVKCNSCGCVISNVIPGDGVYVYCAACTKGKGY